MAIARMIYVTVKADQAAEAERTWKEHCAPLMIREPGCLSEKLLVCTDNPGELISYSEWEDEESIERYRRGQTHEEIKKRARHLAGGRPVVKRYALAGGAK